MNKPLPTTLPCPECGGERVEANCTYQLVQVHIPMEKLRRYSLPNLGHSSVSALVCIDCGYTMFYAQHPRQLVEKPAMKHVQPTTSAENARNEVEW
ncbi:MAG: hypothetical protein JOZ71_04015 [Ktedonobacteraceae bacterium]|nr:hypothetical protein [Ktedonobacteraceae bacterium]